MTREFHPLQVADVRQEIEGAATSVTFTVPPHLASQFQWQAGQHLTLRFTIKGEEHRRSYTISNPPGEPLRITVKRVKKGVVSNHIGDALAPGDTVEVMPPFGGFTLTPGSKLRRTHYFFGAGSGITPLYSMICAMLEQEPHSVAHLLFGNANDKSIIFMEELEALEKKHPGRLTVRHILSSPSMWSWFTPWHKGRVDAAAIDAALAETPPVAQDVQYWICGPGGMNAGVKSALMAIDVPADRIHMESFGGTTEQDTSVAGIAATAKVTLDGRSQTVDIKAGQTILEAVREAGLTPPFSCQSGVCGACKAQLTKGEVHMRNRMALEDNEVKAGAVLTCQSVATAKELAVRFTS